MASRTRAFCSEVSQESGEPIAGTASRVDNWILVEYRGVWNSDALAGSGLSDQVKAHLRSEVRALWRAKLLFIRRRERRGREGLVVFRFEVTAFVPEPPYAALARRRRERSAAAAGSGAARDAVVSPMQGTVLAVRVQDGDRVSVGQVLCIVEAMKMENEVRAHCTGVVSELSVAPGQPVKTGQVICIVGSEGADAIEN